METKEEKQSYTGVSLTDKENSGNVKTEQIGETPFVKITSDNENFIALGQYRLTSEETGESLEEIEKEIKAMNWKFMIAVIGAITNQTIQTYKNEIQ